MDNRYIKKVKTILRDKPITFPKQEPLMACVNTDTVASEEISVAVPEAVKLVRKRGHKQTISEKLIKVHTNISSIIDNMTPKDKRAFISPLAQLKNISEISDRIKSKRSSQGTKLTGFNIEYPVRDDVLEFMKLPAGTKVSWSQLTSYVNNYIKENSLQNPDTRSEIIPDNRLCRLLGYNKVIDPPLKYTTMQRYFATCFLPRDRH